MADNEEILSIDIKFPTIIYGTLNNTLKIFNILQSTTETILFNDSVLFTKFIKNYFVACSYDGAIKFFIYGEKNFTSDDRVKNFTSDDRVKKFTSDDRVKNFTSDDRIKKFEFKEYSEYSAFGDIEAHFINNEYLAIGTENGYLSLFHLKYDSSSGSNIILSYNFFLKDKIIDTTIENDFIYVSIPNFVTVFDNNLKRIYSFKLDLDMFIYNNVLICSLEDSIIYYKSRIIREYKVKGKVLHMANVEGRYFIGTDTNFCYVGKNYDLHAIELKIKETDEVNDSLNPDNRKNIDENNILNNSGSININKLNNNNLNDNGLNDNGLNDDFEEIVGVNKVISLGNNLIAIGTISGHVGVGDIRSDKFIYTKVKGVVHDLAYDNGVIAVGTDKGLDVIFLD
ncbi:hypothetical protein DMUE_3395 [Dictyocoela muelleri]|nr:hypothetical protein DMUE_3395 [Dictyocoela muelleri]